MGRPIIPQLKLIRITYLFKGNSDTLKRIIESSFLCPYYFDTSPSFTILNLSRIHYSEAVLFHRMRAPIGESRIIGYNKEKGEVTIEYRKRDTSGNKTREMDRERMHILDFIARFCQHIPERGQQMVRYYGIYSNKSRGMRKREKVPEFMLVEDDEPRYGRNWRHLVWKIYEADPLRCPECGERLEIVNIVFEEKEIRRILARLPSPRTWYENDLAPP